MRPREIECCKCKWKDIQLFSGSFRREIQLDGNINKDKQKVRCQEVGQGRDKDVKWRAEVASLQTFSKKCLIFFRRRGAGCKNSSIWDWLEKLRVVVVRYL